MTKPLDLLKKRLSNREWRIDNLYYILSEDGERIRFVRNESQLKFWREMHSSNTILKDRRRGFSTMIALYTLDTCLFRDNTAAGIIDIAERDAKDKLEKIKYAYDNLPGTVRAAKPLAKRSETGIKWANNSSVNVGVSHRGGTLQILHVSELGKIAARNPIKAREIKTGAFPAARKGVRFIESTAEGHEGEFYENVMLAKSKHDTGEKLTAQDFKFHFFAWWMGDVNEIDPDGVVITTEMVTYFEKIEGKIGQPLSDRKRAWYVKEEQTQRDDMKREYPSTPEEAFEASVEGAYFVRQMTAVRKQGRICRLPVLPNVPVNTFWDLGKRDMMTVWLHQEVGKEHRFVGYYENSGETFSHYRRWYMDFLKDHDGIEGRHFGPHDTTQRQFAIGDRLLKTYDIAKDAGFDFAIVPRVKEKITSIDHARDALAECWLDEERCSKGIQHLDNYRKEWNDQLGVWRDYPRHDSASHGSDGFQTFALALADNMITATPTVELDYSMINRTIA